MKKLSYLFMLLTLCFSMGTMTSCSDDDDEPQRDKLASTKWEFEAAWSESGGSLMIELEFYDDGTANYKRSIYDAAGRLVNVLEDVDYTYQLSGNTFILTPDQTSKAKMQGTIINELFIQLRNLFTGTDMSYQLQKVR